MVSGCEEITVAHVVGVATRLDSSVARQFGRPLRFCRASRRSELARLDGALRTTGPVEILWGEKPREQDVAREIHCRGSQARDRKPELERRLIAR